jgi:hypothetical protein
MWARYPSAVGQLYARKQQRAFDFGYANPYHLVISHSLLRPPPCFRATNYRLYGSRAESVYASVAAGGTTTSASLGAIYKSRDRTVCGVLRELRRECCVRLRSQRLSNVIVSASIRRRSCG